MKVKLRAAHRGGAILLLMQADPMLEWRRLTEHYREMSDDELRELEADFAHLTDTAQQVLRSELKSRGLGEPQAASQAPQVWKVAGEPIAVPRPASNVPLEPNSIFANAARGALGARPPDLVPDGDDRQTEEDGPREYTWKTLLCECESREQARQLSEALRQAGIESWIDGGRTPHAYSPYADLDVANLRVLVTADQLDRACAIAANPIPQEIVDESKMEVPEFEPPVCPKCGASDPVLEGVNPDNTWRCEQCDAQWNESAGSEDEEAPTQS
jgi:hypothetical protein